MHWNVCFGKFCSLCCLLYNTCSFRDTEVTEVVTVMEDMAEDTVEDTEDMATGESSLGHL
jgi:hypothetical protein